MYVKTELQDCTVVENHSVHLKCTLSRAGLPVTWYKDGGKLSKDNSKYETRNEGSLYSLQIKTCSPNDMGIYMVRYQTAESQCEVIVMGMYSEE